ncbi:AAA family ATPase [Vagococcus sp.]|uniref:Tunicamycin resistance n=2 Tax=Vagococcus fluvialis TaxID=2738 RepID=A0A1X6WNY6_9ENTE|nr:AAA family ATPase [Vagococcus sp.]SLM86043.1 tunicamycin resistance [Vagococcus fluvialis bH819]HCM88827.1 adenylyl-sulfate kinase [Vagococcus sp.]
MIIWINGAYGAGKTTIAEELNKKIKGSFLYDPENIGDFLRHNLPPSIQKDDFQDYVEWRVWNIHVLNKIHNEFSGDIIVPMTLYKDTAFNGMIGELRRRNISLCHFQLEVSRDTIIKRLSERNPNLTAWGTERVDDILETFKKFPIDEKIDNDHVSLEEVLEILIKRINNYKLSH